MCAMCVMGRGVINQVGGCQVGGCQVGWCQVGWWGFKPVSEPERERCERFCPCLSFGRARARHLVSRAER